MTIKAVLNLVIIQSFMKDQNTSKLTFILLVRKLRTIPSKLSLSPLKNNLPTSSPSPSEESSLKTTGRNFTFAAISTPDPHQVTREVDPHRTSSGRPACLVEIHPLTLATITLTKVVSIPWIRDFSPHASTVESGWISR